MHCHFCGHLLTAEMRSCPFCGTKIMTIRGAIQGTPAARIMPPQVRPVHRLIQQDVAGRQKWRVWMVLFLSLLMLSLLALFLLWLIK